MFPKNQTLFSLVILGVYVVILCFPPKSFAEKTPLLLPSTVPTLPEVREGETPLYVNERNVALFHELLLAPFAELIQQERLVLPVVRSLHYDWKLSPGWQRSTVTNIGKFRLGEDKSLVFLPGESTEEGYPFGDVEELKRESNKALQAYKILWNSLYAEFPAKDLVYSFDLFWFGSQTLLRESRGQFYKQFFFRENENNFLSQSLFQLLSPPVIFGYAQIGWQHREKNRDKHWVYSPVIDKAREVLSSNRGDLILKSNFSFDDLFISSEKITSLQAKVVDETILLLPFADIRPAKLQDIRVRTYFPQNTRSSQRKKSSSADSLLTARGKHRRNDGSFTSVLWNNNVRRFPKASAWAPVTAFFVPREVWIIEFSLQDPYALTGKQIVVIDKESMLPFYKIVYSQKGVYERIVLGAWSLAKDMSEEHIAPILSFALSIEASGKGASAFVTEQVRIFFGKETEASKELQSLLSVENHGRVSSPVAASGEEEKQVITRKDEQT